MRWKWLLPVPFGAIIALVALGLWWLTAAQPRFAHEFAIGEGRVLRVWCAFDRDWIEPDPRSVFYKIDQGATELVAKTWLDTDDGGEYAFNAAVAESGRLACVYERTRAANNPHYLLMFDVASGESWPRLRDDETETDPSIMDKWRDRYRRLKRENPDLPTPPEFRPD